MTDSMLGRLDPWYPSLTMMRVLDRPFFVSEWDHPWPNEWRAESVLNLAAVSALQGWTGTVIHTYRYDNREISDMIAIPVTSDALAGIPYRGGVFDTFNDPPSSASSTTRPSSCAAATSRRRPGLRVALPACGWLTIPAMPTHRI